VSRDVTVPAGIVKVNYCSPGLHYLRQTCTDYKTTTPNQAVYGADYACKGCSTGTNHFEVLDKFVCLQRSVIDEIIGSTGATNAANCKVFSDSACLECDGDYGL